jgi:hypothetical protein
MTLNNLAGLKRELDKLGAQRDKWTALSKRLTDLSPNELASMAPTAISSKYIVDAASGFFGPPTPGWMSEAFANVRRLSVKQALSELDIEEKSDDNG